MGGRSIRRAALVLAAVAWAPAAPAQPPYEEPRLLPGGLADLELPPDDPQLEQAQFTQPAAPPTRQPPAAGRPVADPPAPVVRIQVRVPADATKGEDVKYVLLVQNTSAADAHAVTVRNPLLDGAAVVRADPKPDDKPSSAQQLVWSLGTLKAGQSKTIELVLKPKGDAKELRNRAYVRFEHGEEVATRISDPGLKVTKAAPKEAVRDEPVAVRVVVENTGRVPAENVRVVETVTAGAEVEPLTAGGRRTRQGENQWEWDVGTLMPGRRQVIEYRLTPKAGDEVTLSTDVPAAKKVAERAEAKVRTLVPGLTVKLTGPAGPVAAGEPAEYEVTVRNTGTVAAANVRVAAAVPADVKLTRKTEGGQVGRDGVAWVVPRLGPEEARAFRFAVKAGTTGRRTFAATATDARKQRDAKELATLFQGTAALVWEQGFDAPTLAAGKQGLLTVRVRNNGGEAAQNVRVEVDLPDGSSFVEATPRLRPDRALVFLPEAVPAGGERVYTVTYRADQPGQAVFRMRLRADALGDKPVEAEKSVTVTGGR